ncbi:MAG: alcohol dehydrogenase catalytic domain-containing protein [Spirochaetota bacterium]|nr:MAG: alcohol dehydrogenase catalytic domain-containing protein [Spirochaetota bacterium]
MKMKALVWYGKGEIRYEDKEVPELGDDEILVKIAFAGICGAEMHIIDGRVDPIAINAAPPPQVLGHEFSGTVAKAGKEVSGFREGEKVTAHPWGSCGKCYFCKQAQEHFCTNAFNVLTSPRGAAYAEYTVLKASQVYKLPEGVSLKSAALAEPFSIAIHAVDLSMIRSGYTVAILGGGTIGLCCLQIAQHSGAALTILSDPIESRLKVAKGLGADIVVNPTKENLKKAIKKATGDLGVDTCIEAAGIEATCRETVSLTKNCGTVVMVGANLEMMVEMSPFEIVMREVKVQGSHWSPYSFNRTLSMLNKLDTDSLITHIFPFSEVQKALEVHRNQEGIKILLTPDGYPS